MARLCYTAEQIEFLCERQLNPLAELVEEFNARFETQKTPSALHSFFGNHGINRVRQPAKGKGSGTASIYTSDRVEWLQLNYPAMETSKLTAAFNSRFGTSLESTAIKGALGRFGIQSGRDGRIKKGSVSWNKGKTGYMGANATSFKKGQLPHNAQPLWSERICSKDGYIYISVPETNPHTGFPTRYKQKHVWVWEQVNGPVPKGCAIIFLDSDIYNLAIDNLVCVHRKVLLNLNLHDYKNQPAELKPSILALSRLEAEAGIRTVRAAGAGRKRKET